jgi:Protein of unknown function (DUF4232)
MSAGGLENMVRSTLRPNRALWAITAVAAVIALTAGPASALPSRSRTDVTSGSGAAGCQADDLHISVPAAIQGDPSDGMGKQAWNVLFRDTASTACSLRGWPRVVVRTTAGKTVATTVSDVTFSNLAQLPEARIILRPGRNAVVTAISPTEQSRCVIRWTLGLTLPGATNPVTVRAPTGSFVPCVGAKLQLSPFYAEQTLTSDIRALSVSAAPPPFTTTTAAEPPTCQTASLAAQVTSATSGRAGSIVEVRLANTGEACVLPQNWPMVQVHSVGDAAHVAKILSDAAALAAERSLLTTYERGTAQTTALTLRHGGSVIIAVLAPRTETQTCQRLTSVTIYPAAITLGTGRTARVATPLSICGPPRILSFLPDRPGGMSMTIARGALDAVRAARVTKTPNADSAGFFYGTDSSAPDACGKGPYTEPVSGECSGGTDGPYGEYIGELGSFANWKGCTTSGLNWVQANYNMANDNIIDYGTGVGAAGYWFAAGPGRDPHYNGTTSEAMTWGKEQAEQVISELNGIFFNFRYIFMDIENNGSPPDENGWNTVWNGPCGSEAKAEYIAPNVDYATYLGFANYINNYSPYSAGVYSAGGSSYGSWSGIFGGEQLTGVAEWTFTNEQSGLNFPSGFSGSSASPQWFAGAPEACQLMWQWSGGDGVLNGYGDFDQVEAANTVNPSC